MREKESMGKRHAKKKREKESLGMKLNPVTYKASKQGTSSGIRKSRFSKKRLFASNEEVDDTKVSY